MNISIQRNAPGRIRRDRVPALAAAAAVTFLVFAAINAGFTPHGTYLAGQVHNQSSLSL